MQVGDRVLVLSDFSEELSLEVPDRTYGTVLEAGLDAVGLYALVGLDTPLDGHEQVFFNQDELEVVGYAAE